MEKMDFTGTMTKLDEIRARRQAFDLAKGAARVQIYFGGRSGKKASADFITNAPTDIDFLLAEIDLLTAERDALKIREAARVNAHLHIDTEPRRKRTVGNLPCVGISTARGVLAEGGCIAVDLRGIEAVITAQNVAVGRLRPGTKNELRDAGELPIMARGPGSFVTYSQHPFTHDPAECKV